MSNGFKWEISRWGNNTVRIAFWDSIHGNDKVVILNPDGTAEEVFHSENDRGIDKEFSRKINLAEYLYHWFEANE